MTLRSWVRFDKWFLRVRYAMRRTQPARLLDAAELSDTRSSPVKLQELQNSSQTNRLFDQFC